MPLFLQLDLMFPVLLVLLHWYPTCVHGTLQYIDFLYLFLPKVMGTDCATYFSCDDQNHPDMATESYHGVRRTTEMVQKPMADFRQYSTNRRPRDLGIFFFLSFWLMEF
jgi:hypothetical protein